MTREEAKKLIFSEWQSFLEHNIDYAGISEAYKMAIKALEQEPCDDAISRKAVIRITAETGALETQGRVKELPSVTPKVAECADAISRAELLKAIDTYDKFGCDANTKLVPYQDYYVPYIHYYDVVNCIKGMPPVTPQHTDALEKIRAEIKEQYGGCGLINDGLDMALSIIDKYKAESEKE